MPAAYTTYIWQRTLPLRFPANYTFCGHTMTPDIKCPPPTAPPQPRGPGLQIGRARHHGNSGMQFERSPHTVFVAGCFGWQVRMPSQSYRGWPCLWFRAACSYLVLLSNLASTVLCLRVDCVSVCVCVFKTQSCKHSHYSTYFDCRYTWNQVIYNWPGASSDWLNYVCAVRHTNRQSFATGMLLSLLGAPHIFQCEGGFAVEQPDMLFMCCRCFVNSDTNCIKPWKGNLHFNV